METLEIQIVEPGKAELRDVKVPDLLKPNEARVKTLYSGVSSGTELAVFTGIHQWLQDPNYPEWRFPFRAGYSAYGVVQEVGARVERVQEGDRVALAGRHAAMGVYSEDALWKDRRRVDPRTGSLACVARYGWGAAARVGQTMGKSVIVMGLGAIGQFALRAFAAAGSYPVVGVDPLENRRRLALKGGAQTALDPNESSFHHRAARIFGEPRADIVADATGSPNLVMRAAELAKDGGKCVVVGSPRGLQNNVNFYPDLHRRWIEMIGAHGDFLWSPTAEALGWNVDKAMDWLLAGFASGTMNAQDLPTRVEIPERAQDVYDQLLNRKEETVCAAFDWSKI